MIRLEKLRVQAGEFTINDVDMEIVEGKCTALLGKSGSGKTTIMEAICGLRTIVSGEILIGDREITHQAAYYRNVGLVPQDNVLFPTMTVREQLGYGSTLKKWTKNVIQERVEEIAKALRIEHLLDRKPAGLSGGEAKRVAIGRAMAARPELLCLDESFTGLDDETRYEVMEVVKAAILKDGVTTLMITHQMSEVEYMADVRYQIVNRQISLQQS